MAGTAGWLERWTTPLLGADPITWAVLYALGLGFPDRPSSIDGNSAAELMPVEDPPTEEWNLSLSSGISALIGRVWHASLAGEGEEQALQPEGGDFLPGVSISRPGLLMAWVLALVGCVPAVPWLMKELELSKTEGRKIFHGLATVMFLPGIMMEVGVS